MNAWQKQIEKKTVADLLRAFPALASNTAYAWKSGARQPPEYAQPALVAWMKSQSAKVPASKGPQIKRGIV